MENTWSRGRHGKDTLKLIGQGEGGRGLMVTSTERLNSKKHTRASETRLMADGKKKRAKKFWRNASSLSANLTLWGGGRENEKMREESERKSDIKM